MSFLDIEQQQIVGLLREHGPLTAQQLADLIYPTGSGFAEDWDLSASEKIEMELDRCGKAVWVVGRISEDEDEPGDLSDLWAYRAPSWWETSSLRRLTLALRGKVRRWREAEPSLSIFAPDPLQLQVAGFNAGRREYIRDILRLQGEIRTQLAEAGAKVSAETPGGDL